MAIQNEQDEELQINERKVESKDQKENIMKEETPDGEYRQGTGKEKVGNIQGMLSKREDEEKEEQEEDGNI